MEHRDNDDMVPVKIADFPEYFSAVKKSSCGLFSGDLKHLEYGGFFRTRVILVCYKGDWQAV